MTSQPNGPSSGNGSEEQSTARTLQTFKSLFTSARALKAKQAISFVLTYYETRPNRWCSQHSNRGIPTSQSSSSNYTMKCRICLVQPSRIFAKQSTTLIGSLDHYSTKTKTLTPPWCKVKSKQSYTGRYSKNFKERNANTYTVDDIRTRLNQIVLMNESVQRTTEQSNRAKAPARELKAQQPLQMPTSAMFTAQRAPQTKQKACAFCGVSATSQQIAKNAHFAGSSSTEEKNVARWPSHKNENGKQWNRSDAWTVFVSGTALKYVAVGNGAFIVKQKITTCHSAKESTGEEEEIFNGRDISHNYKGAINRHNVNREAQRKFVWRQWMRNSRMKRKIKKLLSQRQWQKLSYRTICTFGALEPRYETQEIKTPGLKPWYFWIAGANVHTSLRALPGD